MTAPTWLDAAGRRRSPATMPGFHRGRPPCNKGRRYPADPPSVEEIVTVMRVAGERPHGLRTRALVVLLWRAGLRISEALAVAESDLDRERGGVLVRHGKAASAARLGWIIGPGSRSRRGSRLASHCPSARLCASSTGRRAGDPGQQQPPEQPFAISPSTLAFGVASLHISYTCPRRRDGPRGRPAQRHTTAARPCEPRDHLGLPARHRQQRDHRHGAPPTGSGIAGKRRTSLAHLAQAGAVQVRSPFGKAAAVR